MMSITQALTGEPLAVQVDGQWRCKGCGSTVYMQINDVVRQRDAPPMYSVEWRCWMGAHTLKERWFTGSLIPKAKPSDTFAMKVVQEGSSVQQETRRTALIKLDTERRSGCGKECRLVQYSDPTKMHSAIYETIMHDADTHERYGASVVEEGIVVANTISYKGMEVSLKTMTISVDGRSMSGIDAPTPTEWRILQLLITKIGRVVTQGEILTRVWGAGYSDSVHLLRVNMARLRKKLDGNNSDRFIQTRPGIGYVFGFDYTDEKKPGQEDDDE